MSSAGCPCWHRGCRCPSRIRNGAAAAAVGGFLGALHVPAPADAPANPFRGVPLTERAGTFAANLALLTGHAGQDQAGWDHLDRDTVLRMWDAALAAPCYDGPPLWLHGDLHPANILVNDGQVSGVIDFGDVTAGDPAGDLSVAWMLLPPGCHDSFWSAYQAAGGRADDALRARARAWALNFAIVFLAHSEDNPVLREVGCRTLSAVLEDQRGQPGKEPGSPVMVSRQLPAAAPSLAARSSLASWIGGWSGRRERDHRKIASSDHSDPACRHLQPTCRGLLRSAGCE